MGFEILTVDGWDMPVSDAIERVVVGAWNLISCVPDKRGCFEGEKAGERYIVERRAV